MIQYLKGVIEMAKYEAQLRGDFNTILNDINETVLNKSMSSSLEESSFFQTENTRCAVRVYERFSYSGGNRVSMNITLLESEGRIFVTVITAGGSQGTFFKINTFGESAFLDTVTDAIAKYKI